MTEKEKPNFLLLFIFSALGFLVAGAIGIAVVVLFFAFGLDKRIKNYVLKRQQ